MSGKAGQKVVTSGRLAGKVKASRAPPDPGPAPWPQPDYSLYSTDSEDQVTTIHKGLDQCAALLSGILQADQAASTGLQKTPKRVTPKPRPSAFQGKKTLKKLPSKTASPGLFRTMKTTKGGTAKPRASASQGKMATKKPATKTAALFQNPQNAEQHQPGREAAAAHPLCHPPADAGVGPHLPHRSTPPFPPPPQQLSADGGDGRTPTEPCVGPRPGREESCCGAATAAEDVQDLLGELRALIAGQGSVAERLLSRLEQTVGGPRVAPAALRQNPWLCRCAENRCERAEQPQTQEMLLGSEEPDLREELVIAQSRLQELQDDLAELRKALQDTRSCLRDAEAEKARVTTELEAARGRLLESEREQSELASVALHRLKEVENLRRFLQRRRPSDYQDAQELSSRQRHPAVASADRIQEYLLSLDRVETVRVAAERDGNAPGPKDDGPQLPDATSHCDGESLWSSWSARSESTFNTRDEAAFRDGLAALDASIASLQKTIQLERKK